MQEDLVTICPNVCLCVTSIFDGVVVLCHRRATAQHACLCYTNVTDGIGGYAGSCLQLQS